MHFNQKILLIVVIAVIVLIVLLALKTHSRASHSSRRNDGKHTSRRRKTISIGRLTDETASSDEESSRSRFRCEARALSTTNNAVPFEDIIDQNYLDDFFAQLQDSIRSRATRLTRDELNDLRHQVEGPEKQTCTRLIDLNLVNFIEIPVVGAYGVNLLVQQYSSGTGGRDILFIHGLPQSFLSMRNVFTDQWLLSNHNVHTIQLRGFGAGPFPDPFGPQGGYHLTTTWADDINATITALGFTPGNVVLACHSYGTLVAADYIRKYGQGMLAGLFISGPLVEPPSTPYGLMSFHPAYLAFTLGLFTNGWNPTGQGWKTFLADGFVFNDSNLFTECNMYPDQAMEFGVEAGVLRGGLTIQFAFAHEPTPNLSTNGPPNPNLSDRSTTGVWPFITVPTHILTGLKEKVLVTQSAVDLHSAIPGSKLTKFENSGHDIPVDDPNRYNLLLRKFLNSL